MDRVLIGEAKRHAKPFGWLAFLLFSTHVATSFMKFFVYENTDFSSIKSIYSFFSLMNAEWNSPISVDLYVTRAECDNPALERTWGGAIFEKRYCTTDVNGGLSCDNYETVEIAPRSSSIFKDGARICEAPREERLSSQVVIKNSQGKIVCPDELVPCNENA